MLPKFPHGLSDEEDQLRRDLLTRRLGVLALHDLT